MTKTKTFIIENKNTTTYVQITLKNPYYELKKDIIKLKYLITTLL